MPVDICVNHHIAALGLLMAHPDRLRIGGPNLPVFNSAHDSQLKHFSFWDFLKGMTDFDEKKAVQPRRCVNWFTISLRSDLFWGLSPTDPE